MAAAVNDPLDLLTNKGERKKKFLTNIYNPAVCALCGFGMAICANWGFRRPLMSGIQNHIALSALGGIIGSYIDKKREESFATRDAILRHYVELHPEDFPVVERKKYADVLEPWVPIR